VGEEERSEEGDEERWNARVEGRKGTKMLRRELKEEVSAERVDRAAETSTEKEEVGEEKVESVSESMSAVEEDGATEGWSEKWEEEAADVGKAERVGE
jgi:hypothetical protein